MAGHSKYANIKHRKGAQDAKRGKIFTKIIRELTVAAKQGSNPADNPRLRACIDKALGVNMTRDTIDRAVARGVGNSDGDNMEELTYEGYAPGGVAVLVQTLSDNRNRTAGEIRHAFSKKGGNLGVEGSVAHLFAKKGQISFAPGASEELVMEVALEAGAEDIESYDDGAIDVTTSWETVTVVKEALLAAGCVPIVSELTMMSSLKVELDTEMADKVYAMIDMLEDLDDVQNVYTNANFPSDDGE